MPEPPPYHPKTLVTYDNLPQIRQVSQKYLLTSCVRFTYDGVGRDLVVDFLQAVGLSFQSILEVKTNSICKLANANVLKDVIQRIPDIYSCTSTHQTIYSDSFPGTFLAPV